MAKMRTILLLGAAFAVPAAAVPIYLSLKTPPASGPEIALADLESSPLADTAPLGSPVASPSRGHVQVDSVQAMTEHLAARLKTQPDDARGWALLAQSYKYLHRDEDARKAAARARELGADPKRLAQNHAAMAEASAVGPTPSNAAAPAMDPNAMVAKLEARLKKSGGSAAEWAMLGRSYQVQGRYRDAAKAYVQATRLDKKNPQLLADYADALAAVHDRKLDGEPTRLIDQALKLNPNQPKALWLAGTAALHRGDFAAAIRYWQHLESLLPPDSPDHAVLTANLEEARRGQGNAKAPGS